MRRRVYGVSLLLVAAVALPFGTSRYYVQMACVAMVYAILAQGYDILLGWAGQLSLSHAALFGVGAYAQALLTTRAGVAFWPSLAMAVLITWVAALVVGIPTLRLKGHYLAMGTLAFGLSVALVLSRWREVTGGTDGIRDIPPPTIGALTFDAPARFYFLLLGSLVLTLWITAGLRRSALGAILHAVRENELAAEVLGIDVPLAKLVALSVSAVYAAVAGGLYAGLSQYVSPETFGLHTAVLLLLMVVLGGSRTLAGPTLGAALLVLLPEALRFLDRYYLLVYGVSMVLIVSFMPQGIVGFWHAVTRRKGGWWHWRRSWPSVG